MNFVFMGTREIMIVIWFLVHHSHFKQHLFFWISLLYYLDCFHSYIFFFQIHRWCFMVIYSEFESYSIFFIINQLPWADFLYSASYSCCKVVSFTTLPKWLELGKNRQFFTWLFCRYSIKIINFMLFYLIFNWWWRFLYFLKLSFLFHTFRIVDLLLLKILVNVRLFSRQVLKGLLE
jgi:hypothetical protein